MTRREQRPERRADRASEGSRDKKAVRRPERRAERESQEARNGKSAKTRRERPARVATRLASRQHGVVTAAQLGEAGITPGEVKQLVRAGVLYRIYRGVYAVGPPSLAPRAREQAALFVCGPTSVISGWSAAYLWGLIDQRPSVTEVTRAGRVCRRQAGLRVCQAARLTARDVRSQGAIRLTAPARTIVDLAAVADDHELERLIAKAREKGLLHEGELEAALERAGRRRGVARLRALLGTEAGRAMTRSEVERRCRRLLEAAGLPQPRTNRRVAGYEVDFLWSEHRVILEVDTFKFHGHPRAFEWDRRKTMALQDAGYHVIRVTKRQLAEEPYWVIAHIARALERHSPGAGGLQTNVAVVAGGRV